MGLVVAGSTWLAARLRLNEDGRITLVDVAALVILITIVSLIIYGLATHSHAHYPPH